MMRESETTRPGAEDICRAILSRFDGPAEDYCMATRTLIELAEKYLNTAPAANSVTIELPDPPKGYDYKRDASGRVEFREPGSEEHYAACGINLAYTGPTVPLNANDWTSGRRPILVKQQERKMLDFKAAVEAANRGKSIYRDGRFQFGPDESLTQSYVIHVMDHKDFYVADAAGGT